MQAVIKLLLNLCYVILESYTIIIPLHQFYPALSSAHPDKSVGYILLTNQYYNMKRILKIIIWCCVCSMLPLSVLAQDKHTTHQQTSQDHKMYNSSELNWTDGPASLPKGAKMVMLAGDPSKEGVFTMRLQLPAGYKVPPHWHPTVEHITVLEGNLYMGSGEKFDQSKATQLNKGDFAVMPVKFVHYAFTKDGATIQLHGMGPWGITYINQSDDPRQVK